MPITEVDAATPIPRRYHYEIFGYKNNPALEEPTGKEEDSADHKMQATTKRMCVGAVKVMLDQYNCESVFIFRVKEGDNAESRRRDISTGEERSAVQAPIGMA